jgi:hypothetical protein
VRSPESISDSKPGGLYKRLCHRKRSREVGRGCRWRRATNLVTRCCSSSTSANFNSDDNGVLSEERDDIKEDSGYSTDDCVDEIDWVDDVNCVDDVDCVDDDNDNGNGNGNNNGDSAGDKKEHENNKEGDKEADNNVGDNGTDGIMEEGDNEAEDKDDGVDVDNGKKEDGDGNNDK